MNKYFKIQLIIIFFIIFYQFALFTAINVEEINNAIKIFSYTSDFFSLLCIMFIIYLSIKNKILYPSIIVKILFFTIVITIYFMIEQSIIKLTMYGIGGNGGLIRSSIYENFEYILNWKKVLFWNFVFSIHYPVYIFIFFKPFVNHLDKSIKKIKAKKLRKLMLIKSVVSNRRKKK